MSGDLEGRRRHEADRPGQRHRDQPGEQPARGAWPAARRRDAQRRDHEERPRHGTTSAAASTTRSQSSRSSGSTVTERTCRAADSAARASMPAAKLQCRRSRGRWTRAHAARTRLISRGHEDPAVRAGRRGAASSRVPDRSDQGAEPLVGHVRDDQAVLAGGRARDRVQRLHLDGRAAAEEPAEPARDGLPDGGGEPRPRARRSRGPGRAAPARPGTPGPPARWPRPHGRGGKPRGRG